MLNLVNLKLLVTHQYKSTSDSEFKKITGAIQGDLKLEIVFQVNGSFRSISIKSENKQAKT